MLWRILGAGADIPSGSENANIGPKVGSRGRPLIAGFDQQIETVPVGGHGLHSDA